MKFQEFLTKYRGWLLAKYLASEQRGTPRFEALSITEGLSDDQVHALKELLANCMPVNSMMLDLWNWDCHFENELGDDWYFGAAFDNDELLDSYTGDLVEFFLEKVDELELDYDQSQNEYFEELVTDEARQFIMGWRSAIVQMFDTAPSENATESQIQLSAQIDPRLRALEHLGYVIECVAQQCIGDAKWEWHTLVKNLESDAAYRFHGCDLVAGTLKAASEEFLKGNRGEAINVLGRVSRELWRGALPPSV